MKRWNEGYLADDLSTFTRFLISEHNHAMGPSVKPGWNIEPVLARLDNARLVDGSGKVSFRGGDFSSEIAVLESAISFHPSLPEFERLRIVTKAIFDAARKQLSARSILSEASILQRNFLRRPLQSFILATQISIFPFAQARANDGARIYFKAGNDKQFDLSSLKEKLRHYVVCPLPTDYTSVSVAIKGRSVAEAHERAIGALDVLRGIWNLFLNHRTSWRISNELPRPANRILLGPIQTIHFPDGKLAAENFWYDPGYMGPLSRVNLSRDERLAILKFEKFIRTQLRQSKDRSRIEEFIVRYCRSLDDRDLQTSFLNLWTLLEMLTGTKAGQSYDVTIKRASRNFKNPEYHLLVLAHLRDHRNLIVHRHESPHQMEELVFRLKGYVESVLLGCLVSRFHFRSVSEFQEFLSLFLERRLLGERARLYKKAYHWLST